MTFDECQRVVATIRQQQGTQCPLVRVRHRGTVHYGRLVRCDSDAEGRRTVASPFGLLVLEDPGLGRPDELVLQIAELPSDAIQSAGRN